MPEGLAADLESERNSRVALVDSITICEGARDFVTRDLFVHILEGEEEHVDFLETQLGLIDRIGVENYIQLQSGAAE